MTACACMHTSFAINTNDCWSFISIIIIIVIIIIIIRYSSASSVAASRVNQPLNVNVAEEE